MTSVLDGRATRLPSGHRDAGGTTGAAPTFGVAFCPECRQPFQRIHPRQLFCCAAHKRTFHNRATVRGCTLAPIAIAARITRDGSRGDRETGKAARNESRQLMDRWAREDREAGRMSMVDYMRARARIGY